MSQRTVATLWYTIDIAVSPNDLAAQSAIVTNVENAARRIGLEFKEAPQEGAVRTFGLEITEERLVEILLQLRHTPLLRYGQKLTLSPSIDLKVDARMGFALTEPTDAQLREILTRIPRGDSQRENSFFESALYFPGRQSSPEADRPLQPHISLERYEQLMTQIRAQEPARYEAMHKGTPFYLMGWLSYEMKDYERGVFYMDAALSEDVRNNPAGWNQTPAASFLFLDDSNQNAAGQRTTAQMRSEVESQVNRYSTTPGATMSIDHLVSKFVRPQATDPSHRSIVTALWTFVLEGTERRMQLSIRSAGGGTLEPFLTHLFKGGLIFESILKRFYANAGNTLRAYLQAGTPDLHLESALYTRQGALLVQSTSKLAKGLAG